MNTMNKRMHSSEIRVVVKVVYPILVRAHYIDEFNNLTEIIPQVQHFDTYESKKALNFFSAFFVCIPADIIDLLFSTTG